MTTGVKIIEEKEIRLVRRIWRFILGKKKPPFFTRVLLWAGLLTFFYYFFWNIFRFLALANIDTIDHPEKIKANINKFGEEFHIEESILGSTDYIQSFSNYYLVLALVYLFMLGSMAFVYRRKVFGYYLFFLSQIAAILTPILFVGMDYFSNEVDVVDYVLPAIFILVYAISLNRLKALKAKEANERISS